VWSAEAVFVCALGLLGRTQQSFPTNRSRGTPAGRSLGIRTGYIVRGGRIALVTSTSAFEEARLAFSPCNNSLGFAKSPVCLSMRNGTCAMGSTKRRRTTRSWRRWSRSAPARTAPSITKSSGEAGCRLRSKAQCRGAQARAWWWLNVEDRSGATARGSLYDRWTLVISLRADSLRQW
jgi:hypothetical protein